MYILQNPLGRDQLCLRRGELELIKEYSAITIAKKELRISTTTINKYCLSNQTYKNKYRFSFTSLHDVTQD